MELNACKELNPAWLSAKLYLAFIQQIDIQEVNDASVHSCTRLSSKQNKKTKRTVPKPQRLQEANLMTTITKPFYELSLLQTGNGREIAKLQKVEKMVHVV